MKPSKKEENLTQAQVRKVFDYHPEQGVLTWRISLNSRASKGARAGTLGKDGYLVVRLFKCGWLVHRIVFLYMTGSFPKGEVDHINNNVADNRWSNLRVANRNQNAFNMRLGKRNTSGVKGVTLMPSGKWRGSVKLNGKAHYAGFFDTLEDAAQAVRLLREELHREFANHG